MDIVIMPSALYYVEMIDYKEFLQIFKSPTLITIVVALIPCSFIVFAQLRDPNESGNIAIGLGAFFFGLLCAVPMFISGVLYLITKKSFFKHATYACALAIAFLIFIPPLVDTLLR